MIVLGAALRAWVARRLEADGGVPALAPLGALRARFDRAGPVRALAIPRGARVIGVGGATLGGSGKTPLAIALAEALAARGERVALVGHAYRADPGRARVVAPSDDVREVGDEALWAARALAPRGAVVVVAPARQAAIELAARLARHVIVDGLLQTRPERLARSLLALDPERPWGSGRCFPAGDLRSPRGELTAATDAAVFVGDRAVARDAAPPDRDIAPFDPEGPVARRRASIGEHTDGTASLFDGVAAFHLAADIEGAVDAGGRSLSLGELGASDFGLILAVARPARVARSLERRALRAVAALSLGDHDNPRPADLERRIADLPRRPDLWITTAKCATKLPPRLAGAPVFALRRTIAIPPALVEWAREES